MKIGGWVTHAVQLTSEFGSIGSEKKSYWCCERNAIKQNLGLPNSDYEGDVGIYGKSIENDITVVSLILNTISLDAVGSDKKRKSSLSKWILRRVMMTS